MKTTRAFIDALEKAGELIRVKIPVDSKFEIAEITDRIIKSPINKALLFEATGTDFPVLINAFGSEKRMCMALRCNSLDEKGREMEAIFKKFTGPHQGFMEKLKMLGELRDLSALMPRKLKGRGACQEFVMSHPDLTRLPILTCWPFDGGPFITLPVVHTLHPETGLPNAGMYRMQIFDKCTTGMHWHLHKGSAKHYNAYREKGLRMPVSVSLGGDPVFTYAASAPLPENVDEYILSGFLRNEKAALVKCLTNDIYVPADADFVIEGYVDTSEPLRIEGPFGDHTGFYSLPDMYPVFHVTCITHRRDAVYPATIVGIPPQEDTWLGKATERIFLTPIRLTMLPEVNDMNLPAEGVFHNISLVSIANEYPGHAFKAMNALWGAGQMMFNKILAVTDTKTSVHKYKEVLRTLCAHVDPATDILFSKGPLDVLDHSADTTGFGGKIGFDATNTHKNFLLTKDQSQVVLNALEKLKQSHSGIISYNEALIAEGLNVLILAVNITNNHTLTEITQAVLADEGFKHIRFVLYVEALISPDDLATVVWRASNNFEPSRDADILSHSAGHKVLLLDATMKHKSMGKFNKDWPNIIVSKQETIDLVDSRWSDYNIGPFVASPSRAYRLSSYGGNESAEVGSV